MWNERSRDKDPAWHPYFHVHDNNIRALQANVIDRVVSAFESDNKNGYGFLTGSDLHIHILSRER